MIDFSVDPTAAWLQSLVLHHLSLPFSVFGTEDFIIRTEQILESGIKVESSAFALLDTSR